MVTVTPKMVPKMHPHNEFRIPTSNDIEDIEDTIGRLRHLEQTV